MALTVELYLDGAWRSVEAQQPIIVNEALHSSLKCADSSCRFSIIPTNAVMNYLLGLGNNDADVRIKDGSTILFQGLLRKNFVIKKLEQRQDLYSLEAVGYSTILDRRINEDIQFTSQTVTAIVEALLTRLEINYSMPTIATTIDNLYIKRGENYRVIENLLKEYGYIFYVDNQGTARAIEISPTTISTVETFDDTNTLVSLELNKKEQEKERIEVEYKQRKTVSSGLVFSDTTNAKSVYKCYIQLAAGAYLGGQQYIYADLAYNKNKILSLASHTLDIEKDAGISVITNVLEGNRVKLSIKNTSEITQTIYKLDIIGTGIVYEDAAGKEIATNNSDTYKIESVNAKYIFTSANAQVYAQRLLNYYIYSDFTYKLTSKTSVALGAQVLLSHNGIGSINARVINKVTDYQTGVINYALEGISEYSAGTAVSEPAYTAPDPVNNQAIILTYPEQPTNNVTNVTAGYSENADGTAAVTVSFSYEQGEKPATQFLCYVLRSFSTPGEIDYYSDQAIVKPYVQDGDYTIPFALVTRAGSAPIHYKIGVVAANGSKLHPDGAVIPSGWDDIILTGGITYDDNNYWDLDSGEMRVGSEGSYIKITPGEGISIVNLNLSLEKTSISVGGTYNTNINDSGIQIYDEFVRTSLPNFYDSYNIASFTEYNKADNCIYYPYGMYNNLFYCIRWNVSTDAYDIVSVNLSGTVTSVYSLDVKYFGLFIFNGIFYLQKSVAPYTAVYAYNIKNGTFAEYLTLPEVCTPSTYGNTIYGTSSGSNYYLKLYNFKQNVVETLLTSTTLFNSISNISENMFCYIHRTGVNTGDLYRYDLDTRTNTKVYEGLTINNGTSDQNAILVDNRYYIYTHGYPNYRLDIIDIDAQTSRYYTPATYRLILQKQKNYTTKNIYCGDTNSSYYNIVNVKSGPISLTSCSTAGYSGMIDGKYAIIRRYSGETGKFAIGILPSGRQTTQGGAGIVEEGTNSNGSYIKFANGIMICYNIYSKSISVTTPTSNYFGTTSGTSYVYTESITFPQAFTSMPAFTGVARLINRPCISMANSATSASILIVSGYSQSLYTETFQWIAIGRWF